MLGAPRWRGIRSSKKRQRINYALSCLELIKKDLESINETMAEIVKENISLTRRLRETRRRLREKNGT